MSTWFKNRTNWVDMNYVEEEVEKEMAMVRDLPWKELQKHAKAGGVVAVGMNRVKLEREVEERVRELKSLPRD